METGSCQPELSTFEFTSVNTDETILDNSGFLLQLDTWLPGSLY